jgi:tetratricopeptide (TPR) repeat protein
MLEAPSQLADFEILRRLGEGGMAEVFLAKKRGAEGTYKLLVVKRVLPAHGSARRFRAMFVEEAHLATRLNHPNIVQVYDFSDHGDDGLLLSMEYVEGLDLGKLMATARQRGARLPPYVASFIVAEAAKGLHYAHERRDEAGRPLAVVHRDVSPQNILVSFEGVVKIADFGIASASLFREEPGVLKGKVGYMSPEQARGDKVDRRSDVYALGIVFYELLTLRSPYERLEGDALLEAVRASAFAPPSAHAPDIPGELEAIVRRALAPTPADRFQTARDLAGAIARVLLAKQELVDNASVEAMLVHIVGRERLAAPPPSDASLQPRTQAAAPVARGAVETVAPPRPASRRASHEVRHVAVLALRVEGLAELEAGPNNLAGRRSSASIRATLDDIAYKHGAVFSWDGPASARAVVGLLANPSRGAESAASLALDVHEALAGASEDLPVQLRVAIAIVRGIASGERSPLGHLVRHELHAPANLLAERLSEGTPFDFTYVAGGIYRLLRRAYRWGEAPSLEIDDAEAHGVPASIRVYALERPLTREERVIELVLSPNDLVGRDAERADLLTAYHRAASGPGPTSKPSLPPAGVPNQGPARGELVARAIVGEMGIGKTALLASVLAELPEAARVLHVECSPARSELPFGTVCDLLREATGVGPEHTLEQATHALEALLPPAPRGPNPARLAARLAELVTGRPGDAAAEEDAGLYRRDLVVAGVRALLGGLSASGPLVVVVDGVQWADTASLELLREVLRHRVQAPILVLLAARPDDRSAPYLEGIVRIELAGLTPDEQIRLVEAHLGVRDGVPAVCRDLVPRVGGNPFFLLEMVDAMLERGALTIVEDEAGSQELVRSERTADAREVPLTLEQIIGDRLRELPPAERDVVAWLAVAGGPLPEGELLSLARLPDDEAVTRLCARGLCDRRAGLVDLRHPLARDVAYLGLDSAPRERLHRLLGEHLAATPLAQGISAAIVARHLARGQDEARAAELYLEAAVAARAAHQTSLAHRYFHRALALLPAGDPLRMIAHEALEAIYRHLGRRRERQRHLTALRRLARESGRARWAALALVRTARLDFDEGHLARGLPIAQRAAEVARLARRPSLEVEALTVLSEILSDLGDIQGAIATCERALKVAATGRLTPRARGEVLRAKGVLLRRIGRVHEAMEAHVEAIAIFRAVGARRSEARARNSLAFAMFVLERFEDAVALGLSSIGIDLAIGGRFQIAKTLSNVGQAYARLGDTARGLAYLKRARDAHERYADQDSRADTLLCTAGILIETGDIDQAHTLAGDAGALVAATGSLYDRAHERIARALLARAEGDAQSSSAFAAEARQLAEQQALLSYHIYATAIEAASRVDAGELHTGVLLATTALGAIEAAAGSEYGVEVRALCCEALLRAAPAAGCGALRRAAAHVHKVSSFIRDPRYTRLFLARPTIDRILAEAEAQGIEAWKPEERRIEA